MSYAVIFQNVVQISCATKAEALKHAQRIADKTGSEVQVKKVPAAKLKAVEARHAYAAPEVQAEMALRAAAPRRQDTAARYPFAGLGTPRGATPMWSAISKRRDEQGFMMRAEFKSLVEVKAWAEMKQRLFPWTGGFHIAKY